MIQLHNLMILIFFSINRSDQNILLFVQKNKIERKKGGLLFFQKNMTIIMTADFINKLFIY